MRYRRIGRIGRIVFRNAIEAQGVDVVAINEYVALFFWEERN